MKNQFKNIGLLLLASLALTSCSDDDKAADTIYRPSTGEWFALRNDALDNITQNFTFNAEDGSATFTTAKGVQLTINGNCLTKNGNPVTGAVQLEYAEVFDPGTMLVTDKTTMGKLPNGDMALIISGGEFYINATQGGVQLTINGNCLTKNGNPVTGAVQLEYAEVFDPGTMLVTDKTTMGKLPNGDMALIISGGEFYINATQGGVQLDITCPMQLLIPSSLTGGADPGMSLWDGTIDAEGNLDWDEQEPGTAPQGGVFTEGQGANAPYYAFLNDFGWTNVDRFYSNTGPKTTILAEVPTGYNFQNSAVYLHYDGEGSALAKLDTFNSGTNQFSEHYGQVPIGLQMHVIFVTEDNGNYRYAIKAVTVGAGDVYVFTDGETTLGTEAQLIAAINALP